MDDESKSAAPLPEGEPHQGHGFPWYIGWFSLVLLLYVLSTGPALRLTRTKPALQRSLLSFYAPLKVVSDACRPIDGFLNWYVKDLWAAYSQVQYQRMDD